MLEDSVNSLNQQPVSLRGLPTLQLGDARVAKPSGPRTQWTFLTNHAHVLIALERLPNARVRDLAEMVDITERAVQQILSDLEDAGVLKREREGRRNRYFIDRSAPLRHPNEAAGSVSDLLNLGAKDARI
jgi:DNA-binding transcriptional ArsR family regulator